MLAHTGWREPISMSGAGKVVDGILRQRPCFLVSRYCGASTRQSRQSQPLFTDLNATNAPAPLRHHALPREIALRAIAAIVVAGAVVIGVAIAVAIGAIIAGACDAGADRHTRPEAAAVPTVAPAAMAPTTAAAPMAAPAKTTPRLRRLGRCETDCRDGQCG